MFCVEEHVEYDCHRIIILMILQIKALESLLYVSKSG